MTIKILFVCHGNICRSPMAEYIFRKIVNDASVGDMYEIASAATIHYSMFHIHHALNRA